MKKNLLDMNLQLFADEGVEDSEAAAPEESTGEEPEEELQEEGEPEENSENGEDTIPTEPAQQQDPDQNAVYANIRRQAEADAQKKFQAQQEQIDRQYEQMFAEFTNPITGAPIKSAADYAAAMAAQERLEMQEQMKQAGVDPSVIDRAIANSPIMQQAQQAIERNNDIEATNMLNEDMAKVLSLDPSMHNVEDIKSSETFIDVVKYCNEHQGMRFADAYKIVNFDKLTSVKIQAAKQGAINSVKGKSHLSAVTGVAGNDNEVDIPVSEMSKWKDFFPDASPKELRAKYNHMLKTQK
jgi:hypothetical protein